MTDRTDTEFFPTPQPLAKMLVDRLSWQLSTELRDLFHEKNSEIFALEPSAGKGPFVRELAARGMHVTGIDPHFDEPPQLPQNTEWARLSLEELHDTLEGEAPFSIACGNPPFSLAHAHLLLLLKMVHKGGCIGFLLRSGFLSSAKRAPFFAAYPPKHVYIFSNRPSFAWSWTCKKLDDGSGCGHKWFTDPGIAEKKCPKCGNRELQSTKTDQYDYMFAVWEVGMDPAKQTTMSWLNEYKEKE